MNPPFIRPSGSLPAAGETVLAVIGRPVLPNADYSIIQSQRKSKQVKVKVGQTKTNPGENRGKSPEFELYLRFS